MRISEYTLTERLLLAPVALLISLGYALIVSIAFPLLGLYLMIGMIFPKILPTKGDEDERL
jgi:hypothetical protein